MRILIACEESQTVCSEFRKLGFDAYSCDLMDCSGGHPEWHLKRDVIEILDDGWDCIIAHPPCTYLAVCGNRWMTNNPERQEERRKALEFFKAFLDCDCAHVAIENPIGVASTVFRKPDQIVQPWMFGDEVSKKTCLWLKGLPKLVPDNIVGKGEIYHFESGRTMPAWFADLWGLSKEERQKQRSKTFPGIARAMAEQWGYYLKKGGDNK